MIVFPDAEGPNSSHLRLRLKRQHLCLSATPAARQNRSRRLEHRRHGGNLPSQSRRRRRSPRAHAARERPPQVGRLDRATFEPHVVCVYANPAQVMRLTQAALWKRGGRLASSFGGRAVCADIIVTTMQTGEPQVILPCSGPHLRPDSGSRNGVLHSLGADGGDHRGLRGTHNGGIRYPITRPDTRASSCRRRARSRRGRAPKSSSGSWTRPTTTAATTASWCRCLPSPRALSGLY
jgi:hypothetical protein